MANVAFGLRNLITASTGVTGGSWLAGLPATNIRTTDLSAVARSSTDAQADTVLIIDHGSPVTARALFLVAHNLSSGATARWDRGMTSGGTDVVSGSALDAWRFAPTVYNGRQYNVIQIASTATSARYDKISIVDESNPAGYVEIGHVFICDLFIPGFGAVHGLTDVVQDLSVRDRADGGALLSTRRPRVRGTSLVLEALTEAEGNTLHDLHMTSGTTELVGYVPRIGDAAWTQRYGFVGTLEELSAIEFPFHRRRRLPMRLTQVI